MLTKIVFWQKSLRQQLVRGITGVIFAGFFLQAHSASELAQSMHQAGVVLMMRHAYAPGIGDPAHFKVGDCQTQRNLNQEGIEQAQKIGRWLKSQGISSAKVYTSPWCRCIDTAVQLQLGMPEVNVALSSTFRESDYLTPAKKSLAQWVKESFVIQANTPTVMVTHQVNITAFAGVTTSSGEMVLVNINPQGQVRVLKTYLLPQ